MKYTTSQIRAYSESGNNILVSAGAGSGKTGVLKKRVIEKLKQGIHIDDLIILTFTNAAAGEMKSRISDAINENPDLKPELDRLDNAIITTFDAFCLKLVKEYHYLLDLPSNITIGDKIQFLTMKRDVLEETIKEYYSKDDYIFNTMIVEYFQKGDDLVYQSVDALADKLTKSPNYQEIIDNFSKKYFSQEILEDSFKEFEEYLFSKFALVKNAYKLLYQRTVVFDHPKVNEYLDKMSQIINKLDDTNIDIFLTNINHLVLPNKPPIRKNDDLKAELDYYQPKVVTLLKEIKEIVSKLNINSKDEALTYVKSLEVNTLKLVEITDLYLKKLNVRKKVLNLYSYQDIMDLAIKLLSEQVVIREYYKNKINEIMIDEYQDTNDLQVYFVSLIANNNLFMVGDIKQSIYGFRDANPKNFAYRYKEYSFNEGGMLINLRENFRSRKEVLSDINLTFNNIMDESIGGINYQDGQSLVYGLKEFDLEAKDQHYGIDVLKYDLETLKEEKETITKPEIEGELLAKDIVNKVENHYKVLDRDKTGKTYLRDIAYSDIAILIDRKTDFKQLSEILSKYKIPVNLYSDEPFIDSIEMLFLTSFVKFINCFIDEEYLKKNFKKLFMSVSRSFVFKISDKEIIDFLVNERIEKISDLVRMDDYVVFSGLYNLSLTFKSLSKELPVDKLVELIYNKLDIYRSISYLDNPRKKEEKLDFFLKTIKTFENFDFNDLINYLEEIDSNGWDIEYVKENRGLDAVKLMTMHKSKGLQFPLVYCPGLYKKFNYTENKDFFIYDLKYGFIGNAFKDGFFPTYLKVLSLNKTKTDYISERIRLLYVAFTRAKENLVLFADYGDLKEDKDILNNGYIDNQIRLKYNSYTDVLSSTKIKDRNNFNKLDDSLTLSTNIQTDNPDFNLERKSFDFKKEELEESRYSKSELSLFDDETIIAIEYGNYVHKSLEDIDFLDLDNSINKLPNSLNKSFKHLISLEEFDISNVLNVYQEYEFINEINNSSTIGIIDLLVEYKDTIKIFDYKLKSISDSAYKKQLNGYREYIMKHTNKAVKCYLYSIIDQVLEEITD